MKYTEAELQRIMQSNPDLAADVPTQVARPQPTQTGNRSDLERKFETLWNQLGGPELTPEYRFHSIRRFRFDFALPEHKIGIEIDGGTWSSGRTGHNWGTGIRADCIKRNEAALLGWRVFVFTSDMLAGDEAVGNIEPVIELVRGR